ncbi:MAG: TetR/AcrR family transcriptional regulator [Pygmaiobacter sp.]
MAYKKSVETKQKIIDATQAVILEKGYANTSIKDIAEQVGIPRTLIYYYYPNKESILDELSDLIYVQTLQLADQTVDAEQRPILNLLLKYILLFKYIVLNDLTRDYFLGYGPYVNHGSEKVMQARRQCYPHIEKIFDHYNIPATETCLNEYVISSDALIKALFQGVLNGSLNITLKESLLYFGRRVVLPSFHLSEAEYEKTVEEAFTISEGVKLESNCTIVNCETMD